MSVFSGGGRKLLCRSAAFWPEDVPAGRGKKGDKDRPASGRWGILPPDAITKGENGRKMEDRITGEAEMGDSGRFCGAQGKKSGESGGEVED